MATPPVPELPSKIGSYRVERRLASGGMGEVFLGFDERLDRYVAIKRVRAAASDDADRRERLRREARAAATLSHPAIVQTYDIVERPEGDCIVMEYLEGDTLWDRMERGDLNGATALHVLLQIADGLEAAHAVGLVHRDLKGENVIVRSDGTAKILDFGVAKLAGVGEGDAGLTTEGAPVGTYRTMSPEQCEAGPVDARSDLFALGVLAYELFGGRTPFLGQTPLHTMANVVSYEPPGLDELNGSVPAALAELVRDLLEKDPADRPASAAVVVERLEALQASGAAAGLVPPRLTALPDSGVDPIGPSVSRGRPQGARRRPPRPPGQGEPKRSSAGRRALVALGVLAALGGATVWALRGMGGGTASETGPTRVMVFPLVVSGTAEAPPSVGEDVATMIGTALEGAESLRWVDAWPLLDAEQRDSPRDRSVDASAALARQHASAYFIDGRVVMAPDEATVILILRDAEDGAEVSRSQAPGPAERPWLAGLTAMNGLLPILIPTQGVDLGVDLASRPPAAVAEFLAAERDFRRAHVRDALDHFEHAFELDSTFAMAGIRAAQAASWVDDPAEALELARRAIQLPLPARSRAYAQGILAYVEGDAEAAVTHLTEARAGNDDFPEAWAALGEVYRHRAPRSPWQGGARPFERAFAQDSTAANVLYHRLEEVLAAGDLETGGRLRQAFLAGDPDQDVGHQIDVMYTCASAGPTGADWTTRIQPGPFVVAVAAAQFLRGAANLPCAEALLRALLVADSFDVDNPEGRYWTGLHGLTGAWLARGRTEDAGRLLSAASRGLGSFQALVDASVVTDAGVVLPAEDPPARTGTIPLAQTRSEALSRWAEFAILVGVIYPELEDLARAGAQALGTDYASQGIRTSIWMSGLWAARQGQDDVASRASERIREIAEAQDAMGAAYSRAMADALDGHRALARDDTVSALALLRPLRANAAEGAIFSELIGSFAYERLVLARLELADGNPERTLELIRGFDEPQAVTYVFYLPPGLALCRQAAERLQQIPVGQACTSRLADLDRTPPSPA